MPEESNFQQTAFFEDETTALRSNLSNNTIPPVQIAQNANLLDIFLFEFEANKSPFLFSNTAVNKQKAITAIYTKTKVKEKPIQLILDSKLARTIITYQLMQQLNQNVNIPVQIVIVIADETQELKISYQGQYTKVSVTCGTFNKKFEKTLVFKFKKKKKLPITKTFMALGLTFNWTEETEQESFEEIRE
ncbi:hypothetical protein G9A89_022273 [Geosiphon pyriformis]|nr:hypothetical protein G9A89_022273 [Geosiphon pyriformis]